MPSVLKRGGALFAVAMARRVADEIVAGKLVVLRHLDRIEAPKAHPLERVAGELIGGEFLVPDRDVVIAGIEVAVRQMAHLVREDRIEHRANLVRVVNSHPLLKEAVEELLVVEDASAITRMRRAGIERFVDLEILTPLSLSWATMAL